MAFAAIACRDRRFRPDTGIFNLSRKAAELRAEICFNRGSTLRVGPRLPS